MALFRSKQEMDTGAAPPYYAAEGKGYGYNASVPIQLLVGFCNPEVASASLLDGYVGAAHAQARDKSPDTAYLIVGWKVVKSEETPGLGEKIKDQKPAFTWSEVLTGKAGEPGPDRRTVFHRQFAGRTPAELRLRKDGGPIDGLTSATFTTVGIIKAIEDARSALQAALASDLSSGRDSQPPAKK